MFGYFKVRKLIWYLTTLVSLGAVLAYIFINNKAQFVTSSYTTDTVQIFKRGDVVLSMAFVIAFCAALTYVIKSLLRDKAFQSLYGWCADQDAGQDIGMFSNERILLRGAKPQ